MRLLFGFLTFMAALTAQEGAREYGRSMTNSRQGIVATSQILASQAGADMLAAGGTAADAAIAANAVLGVVEPMMDGIGGDLFSLYWDQREGKLYGLNASGWSAKKMTLEYFAAKGAKTVPSTGIDSVTVPGCVAGWAAIHKRFGKLPWKRLFAPAIHYAREGFPVSERIAGYWGRSVKALSADAAGPAVFLPGGKAPQEGEVFRNPELARAYELIASQGAAAFYRGEIAGAIVAVERKLGGALEAADLAAWEPEWVEPISTTYRGWRVFELPPNGQGMGALEMLNLMEQTDLSQHAPLSSAAMHWKIESMRLAYADMRKYVTDPRFVKVPVNELLSKPYAQRRAAAIQKDRAGCAPAAGDPLGVSGNTTYLATVDASGNIASWIQSVSGGWGSYVAVPGFGFHLQNRGASFKLDRAHANVIAPRKRPFHTIIPGFAQKDSLRIGFGIMGGPVQPLSHAQFISNLADHGMNLQGAIESPRFVEGPSGKDAAGCSVRMETRVPVETRRELEAKGHKVLTVGTYSTSGVGVGQAVMHNAATGVNSASSDPRGDGAAIPQGAPR